MPDRDARNTAKLTHENNRGFPPMSSGPLAFLAHGAIAASRSFPDRVAQTKLSIAAVIQSPLYEAALTTIRNEIFHPSFHAFAK